MNILKTAIVALSMITSSAVADTANMSVGYITNIKPQQTLFNGGTITIVNGAGGSIEKHARQVEKANKYGQRVVLTGSYCASACTLYLGVKNVCVNPNTIFAFHGPQRNNRRLVAAEHKQWVSYAASYYPNKQLRTDYVNKFSNRIQGYYMKTGLQLSVDYGIALCKT